MHGRVRSDAGLAPPALPLSQWIVPLDTGGSQGRIQRLWTYKETATIGRETATVDRETAEAIASDHLEDERVEESSLTVDGRVVELRQTGPFDAFQ